MIKDIESIECVAILRVEEVKVNTMQTSSLRNYIEW